jgi:monoamine oxidase
VVTLPIAILRLPPGAPGSVAFEPALASKRAAFDLLATGPVVKVIMTFDAPFWRERPPLDDALFFQDPAQAIPTWWTTQPLDAPVLVGWVAGPMVDRLKSLEPQTLQRSAIHSLAGALDLPPGMVAKRMRQWYWHDWQRDRFARGAYSWVRAGGIDAHRTLGAPLAKTLYFGGEATRGDGLNATMDGAIQSGRRVAAEVLDDTTH